MGLLGKSFTSKFKSITTLAVSRIVILKNQHKARATYARSDVAQLLNLGYHDRALLRVEQWIIEQNMLEVFAMIESYCSFLRERAEVLEKNKECPVELKEATSSLIFASSRCGEFPELHKIREILTSKFGKELADHAVELHRNNRVNSKMIQKLSPKRPTMEIKMKALKQIASEVGVTLSSEQDIILIKEDKLNVDQRQNEPETRKSSVDDHNHKENIQNNPAKTAASVAEKALRSEPSEDSKHSNHRVAHGKMHVDPMVSSSSKQEDEVISKSNHAIEFKALERRVISKEHVEEANRKGNMVSELVSAKSLLDNNDHNNKSDEATENEHFSEERVDPSSHAIRWNAQRSQPDPTSNPVVRSHAMETKGPTHFPKEIHTNHEHLDWKMMSVRTR
ncbi:uncharacterized protein LOC109806714 [Cajanus cajan]|uniref:IST1-like protein n=1 Tax=Cajanus cajan TaxID=3821 RepID=A0A151SXG1_CAJCA|nr:uncharacterized protein LOC109806714 [Cajanus cajan]KYP59477.1 IST1-like protein [Cajanus cajan]